MSTHATTGRTAVGAALARVVVALATVLLVVVVAAPAAAVEAQGVRVDVAEEPLFGHASFLRPGIPPGGTATYMLRVRNQHEQPIEVLVYGADLVAGTGDVASGRDNESLGSWISTEQPRLELSAQETVDVPVAITRPSGNDEGGRGAIVVQLSDATRQELALDRIQRAALRVEVTGDGSGDGVHAEVAGTDLGRGLLPGVLSVDVRFAAPGPQISGGAAPPTPPEVFFDGSVVLSRPLVEDPSYPAAIDMLAEGEEVTTTVDVQLPWYGVVGHVRAEAAVVGLTTSSAPVRVVVVPPWLLLLLVALAAVAVLRARRSGALLELGRLPARVLGRTATDDAEVEPGTEVEPDTEVAPDGDVRGVQ